LSQFEVTLGQFRRFAEANPMYKTDAERDGKGGWGLSGLAWTQDAAFLWNTDIGFSQSDEHPVVNISWNDATAFCEWLSEQSGSRIVLPTEAQWEYACRAGTTTFWNCADSKDDLSRFAWFTNNSVSQTHPGGQHPQNAFRLFDLHGNVWEWCADWFAPHYYGNAPLNDPIGPSSGEQHVSRGGAWHNFAEQGRSAWRDSHAADYRTFVIGFRVAVALPDEVFQSRSAPIEDNTESRPSTRQNP
jgi:formylglycine-generating enzyme required for sulfatase activity